MNHSHLISEDKIQFALNLDSVALYSSKNKKMPLFKKTKTKQGVKRGKLEPVMKQFAIWESLLSFYELNQITAQEEFP